MSQRALIFLLLIFVICISSALAETIELKDGKKIVGEVVQETAGAVVVSKQGGDFIYSISRDRIKNIRASTPEEKDREKTEEASSHVVDGEKEVDRREKLKKYRLEKYDQEVLAAKRARGRIKIKFSKDRFGVVDAVLNGKVKASLLVDTGASLVLISGTIAEQLGIDYESKKAVISMVLADGSITSATPITLDSVEVGSSKVKDVSAAVLDRPVGSDTDGLLGTSFLRYFHVKIDSKENCLVLERY